MSRTLSRPARALVVAVTTLGTLLAGALAFADGVDLSHWQGSVNWTKVKADDVTFAFMKATEGTSYADPTLARNWSGAEKAGIYRAAYHFARPSTAKGSAEAQAKFFVAKAGKFADRGDLPPVLDLEATGGLSASALRTWVKTWLTTVERLTGRTPVLYFSPYFWIDHLGNSTAFTRYPLWIAHYTTGSPKVPGGWSRWTFWQRTSSGRVDGISGNVDLNRFNGTAAQLATLAQAGGSGGTGVVAPGPTVPAGAATALTLAPSTRTPAIRGTVRFAGTLRTTASPAAVANRNVSLWLRRPGVAWTQVASTTTDASGGWQVSSVVRRSSEYQARFAGDPAYGAALSPSAQLVTPARALMALDLKARTLRPRKGSPLMVYGHLTSSASSGLQPYTGAKVRYYKRSVGSTRWRLVASSRSVAPTGWHSVTLRPRYTRQWKVVFAGTDRKAPVTSRYLTIRPR